MTVLNCFSNQRTQLYDSALRSRSGTGQPRAYGNITEELESKPKEMHKSKTLTFSATQWKCETSHVYSVQRCNVDALHEDATFLISFGRSSWMYTHVLLGCLLLTRVNEQVEHRSRLPVLGTSGSSSAELDAHRLEQA